MGRRGHLERPLNPPALTAKFQRIDPTKPHLTNGIRWLRQLLNLKALTSLLHAPKYLFSDFSHGLKGMCSCKELQYNAVGLCGRILE